MKSFLKYVLATMIGFILVHFLLAFFFILLLIGIAGSISLSGGGIVNIKENTILKLTLEHPIPDRASENPFDNIDLFSMTPKKQTGLNRLLESIQEAAYDKRISGIYLDLSDIHSNFGALATIEEIRNALLEFKSSGKFIYSYSNMGYSQKSYYLATVADSLYVHPKAPLLLYGMSAGVSFYKEMFKKLGIEPEVIRVGKFKSAVEPFLDNKMSEANREQVETYLNSMWGTLVSGISEARNISPEKIHHLADHFRIYTPEEFTDEGFFDEVLFEDQMLQKLKKACGLETEEKLRLASLTDYQKNQSPIKRFSSDQIAVIYAQGEIGMEQTHASIGPELAKTIREARENADIKAIVLRINSPGGSAHTSDLIWREVQLASKEKPVIASMGNVAASGGYYIACSASGIVADPTTLTGSIGIFGLFFSGEQLIKEKFGINTEVVKTNQHSDFGGNYPLPLPVSSRALTSYEKDVLQQYINQGYDTFLDRVSQGRGMSKEEVDQVGQGRVWTGADAVKLGLVDELGGLQDAIRLAADKAGLSFYQVIELPERKNNWGEFFLNVSETIKSRIIASELGEHYDLYKNIREIGGTQGAMARIPYDITFH